MKIILDQMHRTVKVPISPKRIISLVPSQTELLHFLGLEEEVIGITKFCIHPNEWFKNKTRVGGTKTANIQKIIDLQPDLIIANKEENTKEQIEELAQLFPVWISDITTIDDALSMILSVGKLVDKEENAKSLYKELQQQVTDLQKEVTNDTYSPRVAYFIWRNPYMVAASATFIDEILKIGGFHNLFSTKTRYPEVSAEELIKLNPELILLSSEPYPFKEKHIQELAKLCPSAVIRLVDGELFSWYGNRLLHTCVYLRKLREQINEGAFLRNAPKTD